MLIINEISCKNMLLYKIQKMLFNLFSYQQNIFYKTQTVLFLKMLGTKNRGRTTTVFALVHTQIKSP